MGLESVELVMAVEEEFGLQFSDADAASMISVGQMQDHVMRALQSPGTPVDERDIWKRLHALIADQLGVRPDQVKREAEFVRELGVG